MASRLLTPCRYSPSIKACDLAILSVYGIALTADEATELKKMNELNKAKAFEYFWFRLSKFEAPELTGLMHIVNGRKDLPDEDVVEGLLVKPLAPQM